MALLLFGKGRDMVVLEGEARRGLLGRYNKTYGYVQGPVTTSTKRSPWQGL